MEINDPLSVWYARHQILFLYAILFSSSVFFFFLDYKLFNCHLHTDVNNVADKCLKMMQVIEAVVNDG